MSVSELVIARLGAEARGLRTVDGLLTLTAAMQNGRLPERTPAAFVTMSGATARPAELATGHYQQTVERQFAVLVVLRSTDPIGGRLIDPVEEITSEVVAALIGWQVVPNGPLIEFVRWRPLTAPNGAFIFSIDFKFTEKLRTP